MSQAVSASVAPAEIERFSRLAADWWNSEGPFRALHDIMPLRLRYVQDQLAAHNMLSDKLRVLDAGCGGGLMAEALAKLGAQVTGIDASPEAVNVAKKHAQESGLSMDYRVSTVEALAATGAQFDVITALEIVEHVADLTSFMTALGKLLKPGGLVIVATLNRTKRSFLLAVVAAEYLLRWVESGTHDWDKFVKPAEIMELWARNGIEPLDVTGMVYKPLRRAFVLEKGDASVNYFITGRKSA